MAGIPSAAVFAHSSSSRAAPSSSEYSLCVWRWTNPLDAIVSSAYGPDPTPRERGRREVALGPVWITCGLTYTLLIRPAARVHSGQPALQEEIRIGAMKLSYSSISTYETCPAK